MYNTNVSANDSTTYLQGAGLAQCNRTFETGSDTRHHLANSVQNSIVYADVSPEKVMVQRALIDQKSTGKAILNNIQNISSSLYDTGGATRSMPEYGVVNPLPVPYKLTLRNIVNETRSQDPLHDFILNTTNWERQDKLFDELALKDLSQSVRNLLLTEEGTHVINLIGIIAKDIFPEDMARFNKIITMLKKGQGTLEKEELIASDLIFLLQKYGKSAIYRQVDEYTECCRQAWHYYHPGKDQNISDHEIFTDSANVCLEVLTGLIDRLTGPDRVWVTLTIGSMNLKTTTTALALALKLEPRDVANPAPIGILPLSFHSQFSGVSNAKENPVVIISEENESVSQNKSFLNRLGRLFCC